MRTVPKSMKRKASALLERIKSQPDMSWNERGEFIYKNRVLPGTHVVDLINDTLRHRKSFQPHGWRDFARALRHSNVPQDLVGHKQRWDWMHRESATSDAFSTAEEEMEDEVVERKSRPMKKSPAKRERAKESISSERGIAKRERAKESTSSERGIANWDSLYK